MATTTTVATDAQLLKAASALSKNKFAVQGTALANKTPQQIVDLVKATPSLGATLTLPAGVILPQPGKTAAQTVAQSQKPSAMSQMAAEQAAAKKATATASTAQQTEQLKTARALGYDTLGEYNTAINSAKQAGFGTDINAYNAYVARTNAAINPATKPSTAPVAGAYQQPVVPYTRPAVAAPVAPEPAKLTAAQQEAADEAARQVKIETARQADILARQQRAQQEAADEAARQVRIEEARQADLLARQQQAQQEAADEAARAAKAAAVPVITEAETQAKRQAELQAAYDAQGPVAPLTALDAQAVDQQNIAQLQASTNPNQTKYQTALAQLQSSGQPFTYSDVIGLGNQTSTAQSNAELSAFTNQAMADSADRNQDFTWEDFRNTVGVVGLAALGVAAYNYLGSSALATEAASTAGGMAANGATTGEITSTLISGGVDAEAAASIANAATGITSGTIDAVALAESGGITAESLAAANATANPLATVGQTLTELNAFETAELLKNIDPAMISSLAPTTSGTVGGTASSIFSGSSLNPITNVLTNIGVTNPIVSGALTGVGTGAVINTLTGQPITSDSLLLSALGGGVAGGIGAALPDFGGGTFGSALAGAATNVGATAVVSAVTGQPITLSNLATAALIGGTVGAGIQVATDGAGNATYQYDDGSSMTVNSQGTPVAVTDSAGAQVPVAAVDSRTGQPKPMAPVEDAVARTPEQIAAQTQPVAPGTVDVGNMTQEQLNQALSQNNPYLTASDATQVAGPYTPEQEAQYNRLIAEGRTPAEATDQIESGTETGPAIPVSISGAAGTAEAPSYAISNQMTPGSQLATQTQIDSGQATYNSAANAWEVTPAPAPAPVAVSVPTTPTVTTPVTTEIAPAPAPVAPPVDTGPTTVTTAPVTPVETTPVATLPEVVVTAPRPEPVVTAPEPVYVPPLTPVQNANLTPNQPIPEVQANVVPTTPTTTTPPSVSPVAPEPVYPPVYVPPVDTATPEKRGYGPITPLDWGQGVPLDMSGLNPGYITNVPRYYNNPSPVAAQYYWGQRPYQTGTEFDPVLYNTLPVAPPTPFGLQQMYNPRTQTITNLLRGVGQASQVAPYNIPQAPRV